MVEEIWLLLAVTFFVTLLLHISLHTAAFPALNAETTAPPAHVWDGGKGLVQCLAVFSSVYK
jgi:hypothetical protein